MPHAFFSSLIFVVSIPQAFAASTEVVEMKSLSFVPPKLSLHVGDSVQWKNVALTPHTATANDGKSFDTGEVVPKKNSKPVKFDSAGLFEYHCSVHGKVMNGVIEVAK